MHLIKPNRTIQYSGFSLTELLIALGILSIIATFTIPKILYAQQQSQSKAIAKEVASTIASAFSLYKMSNTVDANTSPLDLTSYMNYVRTSTSGMLDDITGQTSINCTGGNPCLFLHNGAALRSGNVNNRFGGTSSSYYIYFYLDPDGVYSTSTIGSSKSIIFVLYYNGRLIESSSRQPSDTTYISSTPYNWGADPSSSWFNWN